MLAGCQKSYMYVQPFGQSFRNESEMDSYHFLWRLSRLHPYIVGGQKGIICWNKKWLWKNVLHLNLNSDVKKQGLPENEKKISSNQLTLKIQSVEMTEILFHTFDKNFVKATFLLNKLLKSWFHEIFFPWERVQWISLFFLFLTKIPWNWFIWNISWNQISFQNVRQIGSCNKF